MFSRPKLRKGQANGLALPAKDVECQKCSFGGTRSQTLTEARTRRAPSFVRCTRCWAAWGSGRNYQTPKTPDNRLIGKPGALDQPHLQAGELTFKNGAKEKAHAAQRLALPARAGIGGQSHQTPNPPLGPESRKCGQRPALVRCTRCWATCQLNRTLPNEKQYQTIILIEIILSK